MESIQDKVYRKKISLNPNKYTYLEAEGVCVGYAKYLRAYAMSGRDKDLRKAKTVTQWLRTEI